MPQSFHCELTARLLVYERLLSVLVVNTWPRAGGVHDLGRLRDAFVSSAAHIVPSVSSLTNDERERCRLSATLAIDRIFSLAQTTLDDAAATEQSHG